VADGVCDAETVDQVVKSSFGRRLAVMGPLENADYVGLDLTLDIHEHILPDLDRTAGASPYLRRLVEEHRLGMKTGRGFRTWAPGDQERLRRTLIEHLKPTPEIET
jgi:3-hydroxybutyryl-CoA dehydrogenase